MKLKKLKLQCQNQGDFSEAQSSPSALHFHFEDSFNQFIWHFCCTGILIQYLLKFAVAPRYLSALKEAKTGELSSNCFFILG